MVYRSLPSPEQTQELLDHLVKALQTTFGKNLISVVVYGSVARGVPTVTSDIDLLIVCEQWPKSRLARRELVAAAKKQLQPQLDRLFEQGIIPEFRPVLKTRDEARVHTPLYLDMVDDAKILYDRGGFFDGVLKRLKKRLKALGAKKVYLDKTCWYWDLKPDYRFGEIFEL